MSRLREDVIPNLMEIITKGTSGAIVIPLVIGLIFYFPRISHPQGYDAFYVIYESQLLLNGSFNKTLLDIPSIFGLFPFSGYPLGTILLFASFLSICGNSIDLAVLLYTFFALILMIITNTLFLEEITEDTKLVMTGNIFYIFTPILYSFIYFSASARAMIFVLAPLQLFFIIRFLKSRSLREFLSATFVTTLMWFFHRLALVFTVFLVISIFYILFLLITEFLEENYKVSIRDQLNLYFFCLIIIGLVLFVISKIFSQSVYKNSLIELDFFDNFDPTFLDIFNLGFDYFLFWGPLLLLFLVGVLSLIYNVLYIKKKMDISRITIYILFFTFFVAVIPFISKSAYSRHILIPVILPFIIFSLEKFQSSHIFYEILIFVNFLMLSVFYNLFHLFWQETGIYIVLMWILMIFYLFYLMFIRNYRSTSIKFNINISRYSLQSFIFISLIIFNAFMLNDIRVMDDDDNVLPFLYMSDEEVQISKFITESLPASNLSFITIVAADYFIEIRIGAYSGLLVLFDVHEVNQVILGTINSTDVLREIEVKPLHLWLERTIYSYEKEYNLSKNIWINLMSNQFNSTISQSILHLFKVNYVVKFKDSNLARSKSGPVIESEFLKTLPKSLEVFNSSNLVLYKLK